MLRYRSDYTTRTTIVILVIIISISAMVWTNYRVAISVPGGTEFLSNWIGVQNLLNNGKSPYGDETARLIQTQAYGHLARGDEIPLRMTAPIYVVVLLIPFSLVQDFEMARALWMTLLELSLFFLAFFSLRLVEWRPPLGTTVIYYMFAMFWYHASRPLLDGSLSILTALAITGALLALKNKVDELAGVLLAFATIRLEAVILLIVFIFIWAIRNHRWRVLIWFCISLGLLILSALLLSPDWIIQNLVSVVQSINSPSINTFRGAITHYLPGVGGRAGLIIAYLLALLLLVEWSIGVRANFRGFLWTACFTLLVSLWIGIPTSTNNLIILTPAVALVFSLWEERWRKTGIIFAICSMGLLGIGLWVLSINSSDSTTLGIQSPLMYFPLPICLFIVMYWVRWWAFHPPRVWLDEVSDFEQSRQ